MSAPPARFGPFAIVARLGVGGMGEVFLAERGGERVALKLIRPELARDARFRRMFANEARIGVRLCHPNLVRVLDEGELDGVAYLAMEYVDGVSVDRLLQAGPLLPVAACALMRQLLAGLGFAHALTDDAGRAMNLLHRDVSCSNVLVSVGGVTKLADFGIGRADDQTATSTHAVKGKRSYLAPEVLARGAEAYSRASDLYACGVVLHQLVTATLPADGVMVPTPFASIVARLLAADPLWRFPSAEALADALDALGFPLDDGRAELGRRVAATDRAPVALPAIDRLILAELQDGAAPTAATLAAATRPLPTRARRSILLAGAGAITAALAVGFVAARALHHPRSAPPPPRVALASSPSPTPPTPPSPPPTSVPPTHHAPVHTAPTKMGMLTLDTEPWGTAYFGARRLGVTPFTHVSLPAGRHQLQLDVRNSGERRSIEVNVPAGSELRLSVHLPAGAPARRRSSATPLP